MRCIRILPDTWARNLVAIVHLHPEHRRWAAARPPLPSTSIASSLLMAFRFAFHRRSWTDAQCGSEAEAAGRCSEHDGFSRPGLAVTDQEGADAREHITHSAPALMTSDLGRSPDRVRLAPRRRLAPAAGTHSQARRTKPRSSLQRSHRQRQGRWRRAGGPAGRRRNRRIIRNPQPICRGVDDRRPPWSTYRPCGYWDDPRLRRCRRGNRPGGRKPAAPSRQAGAE